MKTEQLILYRDFEEGDLLTDMVWLAENYADDFYNLSDGGALIRLHASAVRHGGQIRLLWKSLALLSCKSSGK